MLGTGDSGRVHVRCSAGLNYASELLLQQRMTVHVWHAESQIGAHMVEQELLRTVKI